MSSYRSIHSLALLSLLALGNASAAAAGSNPLVDDVRAANDRFKDVSVAVARVTPDPLRQRHRGGAMGIHYSTPTISRKTASTSRIPKR